MNAQDVDLSLFLGFFGDPRTPHLSPFWAFPRRTVEDFRRHIPLVGDTINVYHHCDEDGKEIRRPERYEFPSEEEKSKWRLVKTLVQEDYCRDVQLEGPFSGQTGLMGLMEAALMCDATMEVLEYTYKTDPDAVKMPFGRDGNYLLHSACSSSSVPAIHFLLQVYPEALKKKNGRDSQLPLHCFLKSGGQVDLPTLQLLVQSYPEALQEKDGGHSSQLPLHCYLGRVRDSPDLQTLQFLLQSYPEAIRVKDYWGQLPLHIVCGIRRLPPTDVLRYLVSLYPEAARHQSDNRYPVEMLIELIEPGIHSVPLLEILMILVRPYPQELLDSNIAKGTLERVPQIRDKIFAFAELAKQEIQLRRGVLQWMASNCDSMAEILPPRAPSVVININGDQPPCPKRSRLGDHQPSLHECAVAFQQWCCLQRDALQEELQEVLTKLDEMMEDAKRFDVESNIGN